MLEQQDAYFFSGTYCFMNKHDYITTTCWPCAWHGDTLQLWLMVYYYSWL